MSRIPVAEGEHFGFLRLCKKGGKETFAGGMATPQISPPCVVTILVINQNGIWRIRHGANDIESIHKGVAE